MGAATKKGTGGTSLMNYRLNQIEQKVDKLVVLMESAPMQQRDIDDLKKTVDTLSSKITALETAPIKDKAERWNRVADAIFKGVMSIVGVAIVAYMGLK